MGAGINAATTGRKGEFISWLSMFLSHMACFQLEHGECHESDNVLQTFFCSAVEECFLRAFMPKIAHVQFLFAHSYEGS